MAKNISWNKQLILDTVKELYRQGVDLRHSYVGKKSPHARVYKAGCFHFGSWNTVLEKAGIDYEVFEERARVEKKRDYIIELRTAYESGKDLNPTVMQSSRGCGLYERAKKFYSGRTFWEDALKDAEIDPEEFVKQRAWTKERVKQEIIERKNSGKSLDFRDIREEDYRLGRAIERYFGGYQGALDYSGLGSSKKILARTRRHSVDGIVQLIKEYDAAGADLGVRFILSNRNRDPRLKRTYYAAAKRFDSWSDALAAAGIEPSKHLERKRWSEDLTAEEIKKRKENGLSLSPGEVVSEDNPLYKAALRYFGSWKGALEKCGIKYEEEVHVPVSLSADEIIQKIKQMALAGQALQTRKISSSEDQETLRVYQQATRRFEGGWREALETAGIETSMVYTRKKHTVKDLTEKVKEFYAGGKNLEASSVAKDPEMRQYYRAAVRRSGNWYDFLKSAGIDVSVYNPPMNWNSGETVISELKRLFPSGVVSGGLRNVDQNLNAAINRYFGSIKKAVAAAGLVYARSGKLTPNVLKENKTAVNKVYEVNQTLIQNTVDKIFFGGKKRGVNGMEKEDLLQEAFFIFAEIVKKIPEGVNPQEYIERELSRRLGGLNRKQAVENSKEVKWGEEVYFDIFQAKRGLDELREE